MQVSSANDVKIYSITSASRSAIPEWQAQKLKSKLKYDHAWQNRIELIQDFEFPEASVKLKATPDGQYLMATGVYKPQIRVFDLEQMALKFERHTGCENVNFEILSNDWTKSVHLQRDRTVEFHTHYGMHFQTRVPRFGRDLSYHHPSCDVLIVGASHEVWRINLELGRFMAPFDTSLPEINVTSICPGHQLFGFGGTNGQLEFWHPSEKKRIGLLDINPSILNAIDSNLLDSAPEVSSLQFGDDGLSFMVGTNTGQVLLYDLRNPNPIIVKDHQYGFPIHSLAFHKSGKLVSSDTKIVKFWDRNDGKVFTNIEGPTDINYTCFFQDSGLVMLANEGVQIQSYYIPQLGPAPKWCSYLDNLTEEFEEKPDTTVYDDYKFVTKKELTMLGLEHLIGTNVLKAYMHGFFIDLRLYLKAKAIANPFEYEEYKKQIIKNKMAEKAGTRISSVKKLPKVNKQLAMELQNDQEDGSKSKKKKKDSAILTDDRFKGLFSDEAFEVDIDSKEYQLHHPSESQKTARQFEQVIEEYEQDYDVGKPKFFEIKDGFNFNDNSNREIDVEEVEELTFEEKLNAAKLKASEEIVRESVTGNASITFKQNVKRSSKRQK